MASRLSGGCQQCRTRRVKCDEGKPSCVRCIKRKEACTGYRDFSALVFRSENEKAARQSTQRGISTTGSPSNSSNSSKSDTPHKTIRSVLPSSRLNDDDLPALSDLNLRSSFPWAKSVPQQLLPATDDQVIDEFFLKYVMYPCNQGSSPGFLEHLPSLFHESQMEGKVALRWAVRAVAYGSLSNTQAIADVRERALHCYGKSLSALGEALADSTKVLDDDVLMTVVILDIFEVVFLPNQISTGSHAGGMAHILRLRGPDQIYDTRGWSLFRLAHHRLKYHLTYREDPLPESQAWLDSLNESDPQIRIEKDNHEISQVCSRARTLMRSFHDSALSVHQVLDVIDEMHKLDQTSASWRNSPGWAYKTIQRTQPPPSDIIQYPEYLQLHRDVWIAYEWNYHRTARIILHQHLLECLDRLMTLPDQDQELIELMSSHRDYSLAIIGCLIDEILSTVPQSLGDIDHEGNSLLHDSAYTTCRGVGGYFLLWPIKTVKCIKFATPIQTLTAQNAFERIRDCTGMKAVLGDASSI